MSTAAFGYLTARSVANRITRQAAQLQSPRYLVALLLGAAYVGFVLFRQAPPRGAAPDPRWVELVGPPVLLLLLAWIWTMGGEQRALAFSPAEVTLLFPAPITRRALVHYTLLRSQLLILVNTLLWTVLLRRGVGAAPPLLRALALWTMLSTLSLHRLGASFVRTSLAEHGWIGLRHRLPTVAVLALVGAGLVWTAIELPPALAQARRADGAAFADAIAAALAAPVPRLLFWPLRALVRPLGAATTRDWLAVMGPAVLVLGAHYLWVVLSDTAFEEAAAEASLAQAQRRAAPGRVAPPAGRTAKPVSPPLLALHPTGWPAGAILWKNVTALLRRRRARNLAVVFIVVSTAAAVGSFSGGAGVSELAAALALTWFGFVFAFGPQWVRNDLRSDLQQVDLLRAFPVPGWAIITAETLASTLALSLLELGMLGFAYLALLGNRDFEVAADERTLLLIAAIVLLPPVTFTALLLQNGAALLYPAWVRLGMAQRGVEALGQNLLATVAFTVVLALLLVGPGALGALTFRALGSPLGTWALVPAAAAALMLLAGELVVVIRWLGRVFEHTDAASIAA